MIAPRKNNPPIARIEKPEASGIGVSFASPEALAVPSGTVNVTPSVNEKFVAVTGPPEHARFTTVVPTGPALHNDDPLANNTLPVE